MSEPILQARGIRYAYRNGPVTTRVLHGIDLCVWRGEFLVIAGPSGCGKSTLLHVLGLMARPERAESLLIDGQETLGLGESARTRLRRSKIGFVFQRFNLLPVISAAENVRLALRLRGLSVDAQADQALQRVGLAHAADKKPGHLSMGEQQRVAIARAVACKPLILLADEPTGNLDSDNTQRIMELLKQLRRDYLQTIIMVTHDRALAGQADRIIWMKDGRLEQ